MNDVFKHETNRLLTNNLFKFPAHLADDNDLDGRIPPSIGSLSNLNQLVLGKNNLSDSIPDEIGSLSELRVLDLSTNLLTGTIPSDLASLTKLEVMNMGDNELTGDVDFLCDAKFEVVLDLEEVHIVCP